MHKGKEKNNLIACTTANSLCSTHNLEERTFSNPNLRLARFNGELMKICDIMEVVSELLMAIC